jgi:recombination protein RecT
MTTETTMVKYDKPLNSPPQTPGDARMLILAHQSELALHIARAAGVTIDEIVSSAISAIVTAEPKVQAALVACSGTSILKAVADAARFGLTIGTVMGQAYLVPFKGKCQLMVGYRGLESLAYRSGRVRLIQSATVYEGDTYDVQIGRQPDPVRHGQSVTASHKDDKIIAAYAVAWLEPDLAMVESLNRQDLDAVRGTAARPDSGPYLYHLAEMFRKAAVRRLCKHLPLSPTDRTLMDEILSGEDETNGTRVVQAEVVAEGEKRADVLRETLAGAEGAGQSPAPAGQDEPGSTEPEARLP